MSFENTGKSSSPKNEFSINIKSISVFRGSNYDSFYIIGSLSDCRSNLIKFKYFSTKHDIFGHRGVFRVITKGDSTIETYKNESISCFIIDRIYPEHGEESCNILESGEEKDHYGKGNYMKTNSPKRHSIKPLYHPHIQKNKTIKNNTRKSLYLNHNNNY